MPDDDLRDRIIERLHAARGGFSDHPLPTCVDLADAVLPELERLRAELAKARACTEQAEAEVRRLRDEWDRINHMRHDERDRAFVAEAERDALKAAIERVRGKAKAMRNRATGVAAGGAYERGALLTLKAAAGDILAALDTPTDHESHPFEQDKRADHVRVCVCGKWPDHHIHTGDRTMCGCDDCRPSRESQEG